MKRTARALIQRSEALGTCEKAETLFVCCAGIAVWCLAWHCLGRFDAWHGTASGVSRLLPVFACTHGGGPWKARGVHAQEDGPQQR